MEPVHVRGTPCKCAFTALRPGESMKTEAPLLWGQEAESIAPSPNSTRESLPVR